MANCLLCGAPLINFPGKRAKTFCNSTCRSKHFHRNHKNEDYYVPKQKYDLVKNELDTLKLQLAQIANISRKKILDIQEEPKNIPDKINQSELAALEAELAGLGPGSLANQRRKYLEKMIKGYKTQLV